MKRTPTDCRSTNLPSRGPMMRGPVEPSKRVDVGGSGWIVVMEVTSAESSLISLNWRVHRTCDSLRCLPGAGMVRMNTTVHPMTPHEPTRTRKYELRQRAERQAATRRRIVEAIVALHGEVGPARTTVSAIAERAGVERLTVYRHFADETAMFQACSAHFAAETGPPDPAAWAGVPEPAERLRAALLAFYGYYRRGEAMLAHVHRDAPRLPALAAVLAPWAAF